MTNSTLSKVSAWRPWAIGACINKEWRMCSTRRSTCASSMRETLCWKRCPTLLKIIKGSGPRTTKDLSLWKGLFRRGPGAYQHGWRGAAFTREFRCCQAILCLESGAIEDIAACSFIFVCLLGFPQGFPSTIYFSSQSFKRREHEFEVYVLTSCLKTMCSLW